MASLLSRVFFQCPVAYLLWQVLEWAGGEGRGVQNVYKGIGLDGGWGCWEVGWLEWHLMWCFWVLKSHTYISSQCIVGSLAGMLGSGHLTVTGCQSGNTVKTCVKFQQSPVKSRSVSNVEHGMKPGRVRHELNLCVGSPVTEAYGKLDDVSELSQSYVGDGQRLCVKHREFFQNDNRKKARK